MISSIKVSVCVVTYNQEEYIAKCLQSLVDQEADFPFEIIVGDDCSTDDTRLIIEDFALRYPDLIVRNYQQKNLGPTRNILSTYLLARGRYIAHLDGDDYALPGKLKLQCDILDRNSNCFMVTHRVLKVDAFGNKIGCAGSNVTAIRDYEFLIENLPFFANSSKMFRNEHVAEFFEISNGELFDFDMHVFQVQHGSIFHLSETLGVYRVDVGIAKSAKTLNIAMVNAMYRMFDNEMTRNPDKISLLKKSYRKAALNYSKGSLLLGDIAGFRSNLLQYCNVTDSWGRRRLVLMILLLPNNFFTLLFNVIKVFR